MTGFQVVARHLQLGPDISFDTTIEKFDETLPSDPF